MKLNKINLSGVSYDIEDLNAAKTVELTQAQYDALAVKDPNTFYIITDAEPVDMSDYYTKSETSGATEISTALASKADTATTYTKTEVDTALGAKQATLISGTNIKTVNNQSLLGEGNIEIQGGGGATYSAGTNISIDTANTINCTLPIEKLSLTSSQSEAYKCLWIKPANVKIWINENRPTTAHLNYLRPAFSFGGNTINALGFPAAFGQGNTLNGFDSFATGDNNNTKNNCEFATGAYNNSVNGSTDADKTLFSVGNGTAANAKHNAFEIRQNGDIYCSDGTNDVKLQDTITATAANTAALGGLKLVKLTQTEYDALATKDSNTLYVIVN